MLKMGNLSSQVSITDLLPTTEPAQLLSSRLKRLDISLLTETVLVTITVILAIGAFNKSSLSGATLYVTPGILVAAAIIPTAVKRRKFTAIGVNFKQIRYSLVLLGWTCIVVFPTAFSGCWLLKSYGLELPLRPILQGGQSWACWLFYQFMYVAIAEEVFFRWFLQGNILRLTNAVMKGRRMLQWWISIAISAACFAAAHVIVTGRIISVLTFLPGLILGWLFIRTRSLLAPILFHGLANTYYLCMATVFA